MDIQDNKVTDGKTSKNLNESVGNTMGGVILEMESDRIWERAWKDAWNKSGQYADLHRLILSIDNMVKKLNMPLEKACEIQDITVDDYQKAIKIVKAVEEERKVHGKDSK